MFLFFSPLVLVFRCHLSFLSLSCTPPPARSFTFSLFNGNCSREPKVDPNSLFISACFPQSELLLAALETEQSLSCHLFVRISLVFLSRLFPRSLFFQIQFIGSTSVFNRILVREFPLSYEVSVFAPSPGKDVMRTLTNKVESISTPSPEIIRHSPDPPTSLE